ncbi:MAG: glycosyltransferase [Sphingomonas paucimobilis]
MAICVPARNEAARLPRFFEALERLVAPRDTDVTICLLLDSCTDGSADLAAAYATRARYPVKVANSWRSDANAGVARHGAMMLGMAVLARADDILVTTDADSCPQFDWLQITLAAFDTADVVAGNVVRRGRRHDHAQDRIDDYYARLYALRRRVDPVDWEPPVAHHHASGANMALRVGSYAALGGFAPLTSGEDARLVDDAARAGLRVRREAASVVHTSTRRRGRAQGGLATTLDLLDRTGLDEVRVTHPVDQIWQYRHHAIARRAFRMRNFRALAAAIRLSTDHVLGVARDCPNAEAFAMRIVPVAPQGMRQVPLSVAACALAQIVADADRAQAA